MSSDHSSRLGDPFGDIPTHAVFETGPSGAEGTLLDEAARPGAVGSPAQQAFVNQIMSDTVERLFSMSLHATSAMSISSEAAVRERLERLISEADTTIRALSRAQVILGESGCDEADPLG